MARFRGFLSVLLAALLLTTGSLPVSVASAQQPSDPRFFPQTNFRIDNDAFWNFFQGRGGVPTFGFPVSRQFLLDGFQVQIFQRNIMQLQADGGVQTLSLLDPGLMPYTQINGSTFPAPDPAVVSATPSVSDPNYDSAIIAFTHQQAPDAFDGRPVNFYQTFTSTVSCDAAFPNQPCQQNLLPLLNLQVWGAPTSPPAHDPTNQNFIYQVDSHRSEPACRPGIGSARHEVLSPVRSVAATLDRSSIGATSQRSDRCLHAATGRWRGRWQHTHE
jgi:hypothetical protein